MGSSLITLDDKVTLIPLGSVSTHAPPIFFQKAVAIVVIGVPWDVTWLGNKGHMVETK